jgi:hypothetical protein
VNVHNVFDKETGCCEMSMYQGIQRPRISIFLRLQDINYLIKPS